MNRGIKVVQINLHHSRAASAILGSRIANGGADIALIQEPWTRDGKILGLGVNNKNLFYHRTSCRPRACIYVSPKLNALLIANYLNGDNVAVKICYQNKNVKDNIILMSSYLYIENKDIFSVEAIGLIEKCQQNNEKLVIGCDANAHHIVWGSSDCNKRGEDLLEYILHYNLYTLNCGNEPTFVTSNRREDIDISICNNNCLEYVKDWKVSNEVTLSDHKLICFTVIGPVKQVVEGRNPRWTDWRSYREDLKLTTKDLFGKLSSVLDLELAVDELQQAILQCYNQNCKTTHTSSPRIVPWWSKELSRLRSNCRKLFNRAKKNGEWQPYREALTSYNNAIRKAKRSSWRDYCSNITDLSATAKLVKLMSRDRTCNLNTIRLPNGNYTDTGRGTLEEMLRVHFPGSSVVQGVDTSIPLNTRTSGKERWKVANKVVTYDKVSWAINSFEPFKTPGVDGIFPALLIEGAVVLTPILCRVFRACLALGYTPSAWRNSRVIFIPKPGKDNYFEAKSFRPICLTSFLLKTLEKLVDRHIRDNVLSVSQLSDSQFAYQPGKSTDSALYRLTYIVEKCLLSKEIALAIFLDIEGAFDKVPVDTIINALVNSGVDVTTVNWIKSLLTNRYVIANLFDDSVMIRAMAGCPQGGVLSPLLWCLVIDSLLVELTRMGVICISYADDVAIIVRGRFADTISGVMQVYLRAIERWCLSKGLSVNPSKTSMIAFNRKRSVALKDITFFGQILTRVSDVKYLGVYLDDKLNWRKHLDYSISRAKRAFWACRNAIGRSWGLSPSRIRWIYSMIICPMITYGAIAWWSRTRLVTAINELNKVQRMVCIAMSGCIRTTPTSALELMLGLPPLPVHIEALAIICAWRLKNLGQWCANSNHLNWKFFNKTIVSHPLFNMSCDRTLPYHAFNKPFSVLLPCRDTWKTNPPWDNANHIVWYTDGSRMDCGTGAGVCCPSTGAKFWFSLGKHATIFQAEVYAILMCGRICIDKGYNNRCINICSDSQAALLSLQSFVMTSHLVRECYDTLCVLATNNKLSLFWIPGHTGIAGNELADDLAKRGSNAPFIGPEPVFGIPTNLFKGIVSKIFSDLQYKNWLLTKGCRQTKELNCGNPSDRAKELVKLDRISIGNAIGLLTGHCRLKRHLSVMGIGNDPYCRGCTYREETASHILCECEAFSAYRFEFLGRHIIEPWELQDISIKCVLGFINATGLLKD